MKEVSHYQKQYTFKQKAQDYDTELKEMQFSAQKLNNENNMMWGELHGLTNLVPEENRKKIKIDLTKRNIFSKRNSEIPLSKPKNLISARRFNG
jgi:hypothetical protein